jgi:uncharacterized protein YcaQ
VARNAKRRRRKAGLAPTFYGDRNELARLDERLFAFDYRLEIYTPIAKRVHGYYVLPYLADGRLVARLDLKFDRPNATLRAHAIHLEPGIRASGIAAGLRADLADLAGWLGAKDVAVPAVRAWR